jgi:N-acetylneuraminate synthase
VQLGKHTIGIGTKPFFTAEIGLNHNGEMDTAMELIRASVKAGAHAVKFQKRYPRACVPKSQWLEPKSTPWGWMDYIDYRDRMEFNTDEYQEISDLCKELDILWFASVWDVKSAKFLKQFDPPAYKIGSATLTEDAVVSYVAEQKKPVILSTGMSTEDEIGHAVRLLLDARQNNLLVLCHTVSVYPTPNKLLNFKMIPSLRAMFPDIPVGYSGHEVDWVSTALSVALGASYIERHITLDKDSWGSDHKASLLPKDFRHMVNGCNKAWESLGTGEKNLLVEEMPAHHKLRKDLVAVE